jgi:hypothetical protein
MNEMHCIPFTIVHGLIDDAFCGGYYSTIAKEGCSTAIKEWYGISIEDIYQYKSLFCNCKQLYMLKFFDEY